MMLLGIEVIVNAVSSKCNCSDAQPGEEPTHSSLEGEYGVVAPGVTAGPGIAGVDAEGGGGGLLGRT